MIRPLRRAKTAADLKRKPGGGVHTAGSLCPKASPYAYEPEKGPVTTQNLAFLHKHLRPLGNQQPSGRYTCRRTYGEMQFHVNFGFGVLNISGVNWSVQFAAHGSPDGWRYRILRFSGDPAALHHDIEQIETWLLKASRDYPFELKIPRTRSKSAVSWCKTRYGDNFLKHKGYLRFKRSEHAFECKLNWG